MARFFNPPSNLDPSVIVGTAVVEQQLDDHKDATTNVHGIDDTSLLATTDYADNAAAAAAAAVVDSAPEALNTLNELAAALNDDENFATTITNSIAGKADAADLTDHENATVNVHGIADTSLLATTSYVDTAESDAISAANSYSDSLAVNYDPAGSASAAQSAAESYADSLAVNYDPAGSAATAESNANSYADSLATNYDAAGSASAVASDLSDHENATTSVHGISDTSELATKTYADGAASTAVANLIDSAPETLNTLNELAAALGDDPNFATTTASTLGTKAPLDSPALTGTPTAPTAANGTNNTQIATTAFVNSQISSVPTLPSQTGNAGRYLTTDGSTASWGAISLSGSTPQWTFNGTPTIGATTTAPTIGGTTWRYAIYSRQLGPKEHEVSFVIDKPIGNTNDGFGDYLISLPAGLPDFNTFLPFQVTYTGDVLSSGTAFQRVCIPSSSGTAYHNGAISTTVMASIWNARQFRIIIHNPGAAIRAWGSGWYPPSGDMTVMCTFKYEGL